MKSKLHIFLLILGGTALVPLSAEDAEGINLDFGRYYFSLTPKVLEDGIQNDYAFGIFYTDAKKIAAEVRFRSVKISENDLVWDIDDSLLTREQQIYELFLLPLNYYFLRKAGFTLRAGAGLYYNYSKMNEKGYFNDSSLYEPAGPDTYNAYGNEFTGLALGPILDVGLSWQKGIFYTSFSSGVVPVLYLNQKQHWKLSPLIDPPTYDVSSDSMTGPYYYLNLDIALNFAYASLFFSLFHEYSRLSYTAAGFDDNGAWTNFDVTEEFRVLSLELSLLFNLKGAGGFKPQIGYGRTFEEDSKGKGYLVIGIRKFMF